MENKMKKLLSTAVALGVMSSMTPIAFADVAVNALPTLDSVKNGSVTTAGSNMNVKIEAGQGGVGTFNWKDYNIGKDASVNYEFSAHNQTALNKVSASGGISQIYGKITASGCQNCGYEGTGKVILINPNGVLFGDGANVNLNSFTVSNMNGIFDEATNKLTLTKDSNTSDFGIVVQKGATIHGDKAVNFAANNVAVYNGSKISTNIAPNYGTDSFGKVKIVTADGVNFNYYQNGAVKGIDGLKTSSDKMMINLNGDIQSGNIDVRNYSDNTASEINLNGATLKATKAVSGNDGNIWLTASNKVIIDGSKLETVNYSADAAARDGGNIRVLAGKKVSVAKSDFDAVGNVDFISNGYDVAVDSTTIDTAKDVNLTAANIGSIQNGSTVNANNVTVKGGERAQIVNSKVNAKNNIDVTGKAVWFNNADLTAGNEINATATDSYLLANGSKMKADKITLKAKTDVKGDIDVTNSKTYINAGNDVDVTLANVGNRQKGLVTQGGNDVTITTDGTLSVSSLISGNDMTINADKVIAGLDYTNVKHLDNETGVDRSYIEVGGENFNSNTKHDKYDVTASGEPTADGKFNKKHHIQYGENGEEKILLVHKRPLVNPDPEPDPEPIVNPNVNDDQASMLNKLPRQPESINHVNAINDGRTTFVDVFAAASQIEIEDDEE
jgi:filamentous hemagglutinin family protein